MAVWWVTIYAGFVPVALVVLIVRLLTNALRDGFRR